MQPQQGVSLREENGAPPSGMSLRSLGPFFAIAFGLGWGLAALAIFFPTQVERIFGKVGYTNPLFILAVYSPGIAGVLLVLRHYGVRGLSRFLRRLILWRSPLGSIWAPQSTAT
jgi:uncharacterized protein